MPKCLREGCSKPAVVDLRGLCMSDYSQAKRMVEAGETTWEELERMNLANPQDTGDFKKDLLRRRKAIELRSQQSNAGPKTGFE